MGGGGGGGYLGTYLEGNILPKGHVSRHGEVIQLQHVWDALEAGQVFLDLREPHQNREWETLGQGRHSSPAKTGPVPG